MISLYCKQLTVLALLLASFSLQASRIVASDEREKLLADFKSEMVSRYHYPADKLSRQLAEARYIPELLPKMRNAPERTWTWGKYRQRLINNKRISQGAKYMRTHAEILKKAEQTYGVPAQIIVAILGIETSYGKHTGKYRVLDSLYTLGFYHPSRGAFFRSELKHFLRMTHEKNQDALNALGSRAGAMGQGQFMPSSYRAYSVDFDKDGKYDIWHSPADIIGSVANYLAKNGWKRGQPIALQVKVKGDGYKQFLQKRIRPRSSIASLKAAGVEIPLELPESTKAVMLELEGQKGMEYWIGLHNFYVISTYNPRVLYTMAIFQLGEDILAKMAEQRK